MPRIPTAAICFAILMTLLCAVAVRAQTPTAAANAIQAAIDAGNTPGAVLTFGNASDVTTEAFGKLSIEDDAAAVKADTIYDLASLTKPIATATSVLILIDRGEIKLDEPVATYLPEFGNNGKEAITVEQLLRHTGGLIPDNPMSDYANGAEAAWEAILTLEPRTEPGTAFAYTDVGFIVLGKLVEKVSGQPLHEFAAKEVFGPLGMTSTGFAPTSALHKRIAPTTKRDGQWIVGAVHDPRAYALGGVAGHAGLFGTAPDVARWVQMLLNDGELYGVRILSPEMAREMVTGVALEDGKNSRGLGVDVDSGFSPAPRGQRFDVGSTFGHTGYTGGSFWADPENDVFYVLLTNRVHPDDSGKVSDLRRAVATAVAGQMLGAEKADVPGVLNGIDVLKRDNFKALEGKRVAIVTNHTGLDRDGNHIIKMLNDAPNVNVVKIFSPEHGLYGKVDEKVGHGVDPETNLRVFSLYGDTRKPSAEMLEGVDTLLFDIQDIGTRFYTYISTMGLCMEAAKENDIEVVVLDRPNPINGVDVAGPIADEKYQGFTAFGDLPLRHGMTVGELAWLFNEEFGIGCKLTIVPIENWTRDMWFDQTGLMWTNPSPNMRNLTQAILYPGIGLLESGRMISCGRGTDQPFELFGAPFIDARELADALNAQEIPGLSFVPVKFTPTVRHYKDMECGGAYVMLTDREAFEPVSAGLIIAWVIEDLYADAYNLDAVAPMIQDEAAMEALRTTKSPKDIPNVWTEELEAFKKVREKYLLYK